MFGDSYYTLSFRKDLPGQLGGQGFCFFNNNKISKERCKEMGRAKETQTDRSSVTVSVLTCVNITVIN